MREIYEDDYYQFAQEHDLRIIWQCPMCDYEYEDYPGINEAMPCPEHGCSCVRRGESYR